MNKYRWAGPSGYVPGIGNVVDGELIEVKDAELAAKLVTEGKLKPQQPEEPKGPPKRKGGE